MSRLQVLRGSVLAQSLSRLSRLCFQAWRLAERTLCGFENLAPQSKLGRPIGTKFFTLISRFEVVVMPATQLSSCQLHCYVVVVFLVPVVLLSYDSLQILLSAAPKVPFR